jgi:hypothetical protein
MKTALNHSGLWTLTVLTFLGLSLMSELALKLIDENKITRATFLDLGNCGLREVPDEIGDLVWIEVLSFAHLLVG